MVDVVERDRLFDVVTHLVHGDVVALVVLAVRARGGVSGRRSGRVASAGGVVPDEVTLAGAGRVLEALRECGGILGGETSGHMLVLDKTTTGDGLICALQILAIMQETGKPLSELAAGMSKYPQTMVNVRTARRIDPGQSSEVQKAVELAESELADKGRVVLRASGTEPVIRVMVEGEDEQQVLALANRLASVVAEVAA